MFHKLEEDISRQNFHRATIFAGDPNKINLTRSSTRPIIPENQFGFQRQFSKQEPLILHQTMDVRSVVTLAEVNSDATMLTFYKNKLPIMGVNVSRVDATVEAFVVAGLFENATNDGLEFYLRTDLKTASADMTVPPNERFSNWLHILKSTGSYEYYFALARLFNLAVDIVLSESSHTLFHFQPTDEKGDPVQENGYITAFIETSGNSMPTWYVSVSKCSMLRSPHNFKFVETDPKNS